jgi:hypothetical protein
MTADLIDVGRRRPLVGMLGALRSLPQVASELLHRQRPAAPPARLGLQDLAELPASDGSWILLGRRGHEGVALGVVGKFWRPVIEYVELDAGAFKAFAEPGCVKTVYGLTVSPIEEPRMLLKGVMRTAATDEDVRRWRRRYWTLGVGSGAHILVNGLLDIVREDAERSDPKPPERQKAPAGEAF